MLAAARTRFGQQPMVDVRFWDLADPVTSFGSFDVIVSGFAIHHLADDRKRELFAEVATMLSPGGVFANLEVVASAIPMCAAFRAGESFTPSPVIATISPLAFSSAKTPVSG